MRQCYATLRPGGWVESFESSPYFRSDDDTIPEDSAVAQWGKIFVAGGKKTGLAFEVVDQGLQRKAMEEAGFVDICERPNKVRCFRLLLLPFPTSHFGGNGARRWCGP